MKIKNHLSIYIIISGFLLLVDQTLKHFARLNPEHTYYLWKPWLGWEYYANSGIAFSLPFPNWLIVVATPFILLGIILWLVSLRGRKAEAIPVGSPRANSIGSRDDRYSLAIYLIIFGALSNYLDRVSFGITIDYLRVFTGVINLADVLIVGGVVLLLFNNKSNL